MNNNSSSSWWDSLLDFLEASAEIIKAGAAIGAPLFDQIRAVNPDVVACDCETCKWQIEMSTGYTVKHPRSILAEALA